MAWAYAPDCSNQGCWRNSCRGLILNSNLRNMGSMDIPSEVEGIQAFVDKGNFHAAMNLAISAMNECRRERNQPGVDRFLEVIQHITDIMTSEFGSPDKS